MMAWKLFCFTTICFFISQADSSFGSNVLHCCLSVCLLIHMISQKLMQLGSPNLTHNVPHRDLETHLFLGQKVKVTSHINAAGVGICTVVDAGFF